MSNTRDALKQLGAQNEEAQIEAGKNTLRQLIAKTLRDVGISEAVGFEIKLKNGENFTIVSDSNPRMATPASEVQSVTPRQSARAGTSEQVVNWATLLA